MTSIRKVLFPTKFEDLSLHCVERLYPLREAGLEEIVFLFVIDRDEVAFNLLTGFDRQLAEQLREEANLRFQDWAREVHKAGFRTKAVVEIGVPEGKVLEVACKEGVDLIVSGRHRRLAADAVYLGGTAMRVLRRTAIPVFLCKHDSAEENAGEAQGGSVYERVLFATDFSEDSGGARRFLEALDGAVRRVDAVHVLTGRDLQGRSGQELRGVEEEARAQLEAVCTDLRRQGLEADGHLLAGHTAGEILKASVDHRSTLILMATKGKHGIREMWLGSASHRVAELSKIPVVLVPRPREQCYV